MPQPADPLIRRRLLVEGVVQGVGFRPFVARLATRQGLAGWVANRDDGVQIEVEGEAGELDRFEAELLSRTPTGARIDRLHGEAMPPLGGRDFRIAPSLFSGGAVPTVQADRVTCPVCLAEMNDPANRRYRYPFISCAECGPRFSIVESLPFDRARTTLRDFPLCPACLAEYGNPDDRRFHAQTMGCPACGPRLFLATMVGEVAAQGEAALNAALAALRDGRIVALKGIGGFQLLVDAGNEAAVQRLRERKARPAKPLAIMVDGLDAARRLCHVAPEEADLLAGPAGPIVLLHRWGDGQIAPAVAPDTPYLGVMLASSGLHALLLAGFGGALVATSGNRAGEPIAIETDDARRRLAGIADVLLTHERRIAARLDDSLAQWAAGAPQVLRRARGYVPLSLPLLSGPGVLALGGHLKNTVASGLGAVAVLSQHNGDLDTEKARAGFADTLAAQARLYGQAPRALVCDAHPDYASSRAAGDFGLPVARVWHHHAHLHAVMAEFSLAPPLLGVAWDGLGLGEDGVLRGGEWFRVTGAGIEPAASLMPFPLPGGEAAVREPRRAALGLFYAWEGERVFERSFVHEQFTPAERQGLGRMLAGGVNCPMTTSVGRLFDALSSAFGLRRRNGFEGEAAMQLQFAAERGGQADACPFGLEGRHLDWRPMLAALLAEQAEGAEAPALAARFHATLAAMLLAVARRERLPTVALAGGCFQNRLLLGLCAKTLRQAGFAVHWPQRVPPNDGGLALGQLSAFRYGHLAR